MEIKMNKNIDRNKIGQSVQLILLSLPLNEVKVEFDQPVTTVNLSKNDMWTLPACLLLDTATKTDSLEHGLDEFQAVISKLNQKVTTKPLAPINDFKTVLLESCHDNEKTSLITVMLKIAQSFYKKKLVITNPNIEISKAELAFFNRTIYQCLALCVPYLTVTINGEELTSSNDKKSAISILLIEVMDLVLHISPDTVLTNLQQNAPDSITQNWFTELKKYYKKH